MQISVYNNGQQLGPFPLDAIHNMVRLGSLPDTAVVWYEGAPDWIPLPTFLQQYPVPAAPAASPAHSAAPGRMSTQQMLSASHAPAGGGQLSDSARLLRATIAGGVAALIGGGVWAGIAIGINREIGWVAWGIGVLCGFAVSKLGRGHGTIFQAMADISIMDTLGVVDIVFVVFAVGSAWSMAGGNK